MLYIENDKITNSAPNLMIKQDRKTYVKYKKNEIDNYNMKFIDPFEINQNDENCKKTELNVKISEYKNIIKKINKINFVDKSYKKICFEYLFGFYWIKKSYIDQELIYWIYPCLY